MQAVNLNRFCHGYASPRLCFLKPDLHVMWFQTQQHTENKRTGFVTILISLYSITIKYFRIIIICKYLYMCSYIIN